MNTQELPLLPGVNGYDKYAIRCNPETKRIESATYEIFGDSNDFITTILPENKISDYLLINNEYIYDPLPEPEPPPYEPTADDLMDILLGVSE